MHYARRTIAAIAEYSPITLPWNRAEKLSASMQKKLEAQQKQLQDFATTLTSQKQSRTGKNPLFQDKFNYLHTQITNLHQKIISALKTQTISSSEFNHLQTHLKRIEKTIHELSRINRQLKQAKVKTRRILSKAASKEIAVVASHEPITNTYREQVLKLKTYEEQIKLTALQQFWQRTPTNSTAKISVVTQTIDNQKHSIAVANPQLLQR